MSFVWINGQLVDKAEAKFSVFDHGFLYGDGVWAAVRAFHGTVLWPDRLLQTILGNALGIAVPYTAAELLAAIHATLQANGRTEGYIRVIATRGAGTVGPDPRKLHPNVIVIAEEYQPFPLELYEHGLNVVRFPNVPPAGFESILGESRLLVEAKRFALEHGCLDVLFHDESRRVRSAIEGQVYIVKNGQLHGEATQMMEALVHSSDVPLATELGDVEACDEALLAGVSCGVIAIVQMDGRPIGDGREGPITKRIRTAYHRLTRGDA